MTRLGMTSILHAATNVEPGDIVLLTDGREALVTARVETPAGSPFGRS